MFFFLFLKKKKKKKKKQTFHNEYIGIITTQLKSTLKIAREYNIYLAIQEIVSHKSS